MMRALGCIWKAIQLVLMVVGAATIILGIVVGAFLYNFSQPTDIEKQMHPVETSEQLADAFTEAWDAFEQAAREASIGDTVEVILSEAEVSSRVMEQIGKVGLPFDVKKAWVNFLPGSVHILWAAEGSVLGLSVHIGGKAWVEIREENGKTVLWYQLEELDFGRVPGSIKDIIMENIGDEMEGTWEPPEDWGLDLSSINIEGDQVIIKGTKVAWGPTS